MDEEQIVAYVGRVYRRHGQIYRYYWYIWERGQEPTSPRPSDHEFLKARDAGCSDIWFIAVHQMFKKIRGLDLDYTIIREYVTNEDRIPSRRELRKMRRELKL